MKISVLITKGIWNDRLILIMNFWIRERVDRASTTLCFCFIFYNFHAKQKGDIKQAPMTLSSPREFVCPAGMNKLNMNIQDKAASDLPYAICTGNNAALPSRAQQKGIFIKPIPFRNDHFEWRKTTGTL